MGLSWIRPTKQGKLPVTSNADYWEFVLRPPGSPGLLSSLHAFYTSGDTNVSVFHHHSGTGTVLWERDRLRRTSYACLCCNMQIQDQPCVLLPLHRVVCIPCYYGARLEFLLQYVLLARQFLASWLHADVAAYAMDIATRVFAEFNESVVASFNQRAALTLARLVTLQLHHRDDIAFSLVFTRPDGKVDALLVGPSHNRTLDYYIGVDETPSEIYRLQYVSWSWAKALAEITEFSQGRPCIYIPYSVGTQTALI